MRTSILLLLALLPGLACQLPSRREAGPSRDLATRVAGLEHLPGLFDVYLDRRGGKVHLVLPPAGPAEYGRVMTACLYVEGLSGGLGSNPVGLDRGQIGDTRVVTFRRLGDRVLMEQPNQEYRASSRQPAERRAAQESFATSVLWSGEVLAEDATGRALVDITSLVVSDAHESAAKLESSGQGSWSLDPDRSFVDFDAVLAFPDNLEFDALLTFEGARPGPEVRSTAPTDKAVSLVQHHSLVRLPNSDYQTRRLDPRMGHMYVDYLDYAAPIDQPNRIGLAKRHRLRRLDPRGESSRATVPIVYFVDRGAPEPVRTALLEGARWWAEAFEAAGFEDAYRVELLPEGVHPLDVRYNVIQWVHRSTRGWSYGGGVTDPRTGEIIKGHVSLGSLRVRQDRLLFEGLLGAEQTGGGAETDPVELALARIRQLSAHEVGHTLGLMHNFSASTYGRASVMDYPAPLVTMGEDGEIDVSEAYDVGVGEWDIHAIRWLYSEFPPDVNEREALDAIVADGQERGLRYHSDDDARGLGAALSTASLWDNGADPIAMLDEVLDVRAAALARFGERNLRSGRPRAELEEVLVPLYFHHRYQLHAAAKTIGGLEFQHALVGDELPYPAPVSAERQERALVACLRALSPATLDMPSSVLDLMGPRTPTDPSSRERFARVTGAGFDSLGAARSGAQLVVDLLFEPSRCARLVEAHSRNPELPTLQSVLERVVDSCFAAQVDARRAAVALEIQHTVLEGLMDLADDPRATAQVRAVATRILMNMGQQDAQTASSWDPSQTHQARIRRFLARDFEPALRHPAAAEAPPGSPIGSMDAGQLCGCSMPGHL